jgi:hypothetical protein
MNFSVKKLFIFGIVFSSIYIFLANSIGINSGIINRSNFNFINLSYLIHQNLIFFGGLNGWTFDIFGYLLNFNFLLYFLAYIILPFTFIIDFFINVTLLIVYELAIINYPFSILPYGFGSLLSGIFYMIFIVTIITSIRILSSGLNGGSE